MKDLRPSASVWKPPMSTLIHLLTLLLVLGLAVGPLSLTSAQAPGIRITELRCNDDPEVVAVTNTGSASQDLTGWTLRSAPPTSEVFDLSTVGVLAAGATVFVQSGPQASGSFIWSRNLLFRDTTAYARIVNAAGAVVQEVKCAGGSPVQTPTPSPTSPNSAVPDGGGLPPSSTWLSSSSPILMMAAGGLLMTLGGGAVIALWPRQAAVAEAIGRMERGSSVASPAGSRGRPLYLLASLGMVVLIIRLMTGRRR